MKCAPSADDKYEWTHVVPRGTERCVVLLGSSNLTNRGVAAKFYRSQEDFLHEREFYLGAEVRGWVLRWC